MTKVIQIHLKMNQQESFRNKQLHNLNKLDQTIKKLFKNSKIIARVIIKDS